MGLTRLLCPWDFRARILEWVAIFSSRGSSQPRDRTGISREFFTTVPPRKPQHPFQSQNFLLKWEGFQNHPCRIQRAAVSLHPRWSRPKVEGRNLFWGGQVGRMGSERHFFSFESAMGCGSSSEQASFLSAATACLPCTRSYLCQWKVW